MSKFFEEVMLPECHAARRQIGIFSCGAGMRLATKIADRIKEIQPLYNKLTGRDEPVGDVLINRPDEDKKPEEQWFANGEVCPNIKESLRNRDVFIIQDTANTTTGRSVNDHLLALILTVNAAKQGAYAPYVNAVSLYLPYERQDKIQGRQSYSAALILKIMDLAGADNFVTLDIHNEALMGVPNPKGMRLENMIASKSLIDYIDLHPDVVDISNAVVIAPDTGAVGRNKFYANFFEKRFGFFYKVRDYSEANLVKRMDLLGEVKGKDVLVFDDMADTCGTLLKCARILKDRGAKRINVGVSNALLSGSATDSMMKAYEQELLSRCLITNSIFHGDNFCQQYPVFSEVDVSNYTAEGIFCINHETSLSEMLSHYKKKDDD